MGNAWAHGAQNIKTRWIHKEEPLSHTNQDDTLESIIIECEEKVFDFKWVSAIPMTQLKKTMDAIQYWWNQNNVSSMHFIGYGNIFLPIQSVIDFGSHACDSNIFLKLSSNPLGDDSGNITVGNSIRYIIDQIKKDKTPRVLIIYMNAWITRKYNDKHFSIFEYDVYTAIQEAFQVPLFVIFKPRDLEVYSDFYTNYARFETDYTLMYPQFTKNFTLQIPGNNNPDQDIRHYFDWWYINYSDRLKGNNLVRPRLYNPKLLNTHSSLCCLCNFNTAVIAKPCFHMFCQSCNPKKTHCPLCPIPYNLGRQLLREKMS